MNSNEAHWEPLAEIYLSYPTGGTNGEAGLGSAVVVAAGKEKKKCIYCLCSRVFIRNYYDVYVSTLERGEPSKWIFQFFFLLAACFAYLCLVFMAVVEK